MKYIEYDSVTGRILSVLTASAEPEAITGRGFLQIGDDEEIDATVYSVRDGVLVRTVETNQERLERERIKREYGEKCRRRRASMRAEFVDALMDENEQKIKALKREAAKMKPYL